MSKREKGLMLALSVSLALNLFLLGFAVARRLAHGGARGRDGGAMQLDAPHHLMRALRHAGGGEHARHALMAHRGELRAQRRAMREAQRQAAVALAADPFDRLAVEQALAALRERATASQQTAHEVVVEVAAELPAEERAQLLGGGPGKRGAGFRR